MECRSDGCESGCRRVRGGPVEKGACRPRGREGGERGRWARPPGSEPEADTQPCSQHSARGCMPPASRGQSRWCQEPRGLQRLVARPGVTDFIPLRRAGEPRGLELCWAWREPGKGSPELGAAPAVVGTPSRRGLQEADRALVPRSGKGVQEGWSPAGCLGWGLDRNTDGAACVRRLYTRVHTHTTGRGATPAVRRGPDGVCRRPQTAPKERRAPGAPLKVAPQLPSA